MERDEFDFLQQIASGEGWDGIEDAEPRLRKLQEAQARAEMEQRLNEARIVKDALANEPGKKFVAWLGHKTVMRPPSDIETGATTAEAYAIAKARREGQNAILFMIIEALGTRAGEKKQDKENDL